MTNPSPTQAPATPSPTDLITKARPAIEWLAENTDCSGLPDWVTIDPNGNGKIREISDYEIWVHNPPAVLAAICMWVMDELEIWLRDNHSDKTSAVYASVSAFQNPHHSKTERGWRTRRTIALLLAIVECLKGGPK